MSYEPTDDELITLAAVNVAEELAAAPPTGDPERCPTCGSSDPDRIDKLFPCSRNPDPDPWHDTGDRERIEATFCEECGAQAGHQASCSRAGDRGERPEDVLREVLEWIAPPHGLTKKRCPPSERLQEAEEQASKALTALDALVAERDAEAVIRQSEDGRLSITFYPEDARTVRCSREVMEQYVDDLNALAAERVRGDRNDGYVELVGDLFARVASTGRADGEPLQALFAYHLSARPNPEGSSDE